MHERLEMLAELAKVRIAVLATASTLTGFVLAAGGLGPAVVQTVVGVFLLAAGAGALNQFQERDVDAMMRRTMSRPIPSGRIRPASALAVAVALIAGGTACLLSWPEAALLGLLTVAWYNGVYTNLKRISAFAAIPGGVVGAIPPVIGWVAGGGHVLDPRILAVAFFFFIWQVPHFWLLLLRIGPDYERAGLPSLTAVFSRRQLARITYVWMLATAVASLLIPFYSVSHSAWTSIGFVGAALWLGWHATVMVRTEGTALAFREINIFALMVISLLSVGGFLG